MKMGVPSYSSWHVPQQRQEKSHGPHSDILPQSALPRQRPKRPGEYSYPRAAGPAVSVHSLPQDLRSHQGHRLLSSADLCGDDQLRGDVDGPRLSAAGHCHRVRLRRADCGALGDARWRPRASEEHLVEPPRDLGQVQADEIRVKKQGGIVWMALAMMVTTRLWLGGAVSEQRAMPLIRRLSERVKRCAAPRPLLVCTDGLVSYMRAIRETWREPVHTGHGGRPRLRPWRNILLAPVVKRYERRRVVETEGRLVDGTPARVETLRRRSQGTGVINTAYIERLNATFRERLASLTRRGRALARHTPT